MHANKHKTMKELIAESLAENKQRKEALKKQLDFSALEKIMSKKQFKNKRLRTFG